jgi:hypothetical protein
MIKYIYSMLIVICITIFFVFINFYLNTNKLYKNDVIPIKINENNYKEKDYLPNIVNNIDYPTIKNNKDSNDLANVFLNFINTNYDTVIDFTIYKDESLLFSEIPINFIENGIEMEVIQFMEINNELPKNVFYIVYI